MASKEFNLRLIFQVLDRATGPMRKIGGAIDRVGKATGLNKVAQAGGALLAGFGRVGREAIAFGTRVTAATAAAGAGLFALVKRSANAADRLAKTADKLGIGIETLQQLRYTASLAGIEQGKLDVATQRFTRRVAEAAAGTGVAKDALAALGIELKDGHGNIRATEDLLFDVADKMAAIEDPAKRVRLAFTLFDTEGVDMVNMLSKGSAAMRETFEEARKLGLITEQDARRSEEFNDQLTKLWLVIGNVGDIIASHLLPSMQQGVVWLRNFIVEMRPAAVRKMAAAIEEISAIATWVGETWSEWTATLGAWTRSAMLVSPIVAAIVGQITRLVRSVGASRIVLGFLATALGVKLLFAIAALFVPLTQLGIALAAMTVKMTVLAVKGIAAMAGALVGMLPAIGSMIAATWAWTAALLANPLTWMFIAIMAAIAAVVGGMYLLIRHWDDVVAYFKAGWQTIKAAFNDAWQAIKGASSAALDWLQARLAGAASAIVDALASAWAPIAGVFLSAWSGIATALIDTWARIRGAFEEGVITAILRLLSTFNPLAPVARAVDAIVQYLAGVSLIDHGNALLDGLRAGIVSGATRLLAPIKGLASQISAWFSAIDLTAASGAIVGGLLAAIVSGAQTLVARIKEIAAGIAAWFSAIDLAAAGGAIMSGLLAGIVSGAQTLVARIKEIAAGIAAWFSAIDLAAAGGAIMGGLLGGLTVGLPAIATWLADAVSALSGAIPGDALAIVGGALIGGMLAGLKGAWSTVLAWIETAIDGLETWLEGRLDKLLGWVSRQVDEVTGFLPDWVKEKIGLPEGGTENRPASALSAPVPSALGPGSQEIGGEVLVRFENAPANMRVAERKSTSRGVSLGVDTGYAMGH